MVGENRWRRAGLTTCEGASGGRMGGSPGGADNTNPGLTATAIEEQRPDDKF